jgi:DNA-binding MarR family transcriptional regulator
MSLARWQRVTHLLLADLHDRILELGLSPGEVNVLAAFEEEDALTVGQLLGCTGHRPSTLTGILRRLESRRLIRRTRNPNDGRSAVLALTPHGMQTRTRILTAFDEVSSSLPAETNTLLDIVERALRSQRHGGQSHHTVG